MPARTSLSEAEIQRLLREFKVSRGSLQYEDLEMVSMDPRLDDWSSFPVEHDSPVIVGWIVFNRQRKRQSDDNGFPPRRMQSLTRVTPRLDKTLLYILRSYKRAFIWR